MDEPEALTVNSTIKLEVTEVFRSEEAQVIGEGEYLLTAADTSNKGDVFDAFEVGARITLQTECEDDALSEAQWAGGVGDTLVKIADNCPIGKKTFQVGDDAFISFRSECAHLLET